jgi:hypothetical protein
MTAASWLRRAARGPLAVARRLRGRTRAELPAADGATVFARWAAQARAVGIDQLVLFLSFDCDTDRDADVADALHADLERRGIASSWAVPGTQLRRSPEPYRRIAERGACFMNHGSRPHAQWRDDRYHPVTFYDQMTTEEVRADLRAGHDDVRAVIGRAPTGLRAPHFGSFQAPAQRGLLHTVAGELGYRWCSTTVPALALEQGPLVRCDGLWEIPLFGSWRAPLNILDSWSQLSDRCNYALSDDFYDLFEETVERLLEAGLPGLLSYYVDPAHVAGQRAFERALALVERRRLPSLDGDALVRQAERASLG